MSVEGAVGGYDYFVVGETVELDVTKGSRGLNKPAIFEISCPGDDGDLVGGPIRSVVGPGDSRKRVVLTFVKAGTGTLKLTPVGNSCQIHPVAAKVALNDNHGQPAFEYQVKVEEVPEIFFDEAAFGAFADDLSANLEIYFVV